MSLIANFSGKTSDREWTAADFLDDEDEEVDFAAQDAKIRNQMERFVLALGGTVDPPKVELVQDYREKGEA